MMKTILRKPFLFPKIGLKILWDLMNNLAFKQNCYKK